MAATQALKYLVTADTGGFAKSMGGLKGIVIAAGAAIAAAFVNAIKVTAEFEKSLSRLGAISQASNNDLKVLEQQAKKLGATTASTATEILSLQTELAKLGFTTREILDATPGVRDFADALETDLASAAALAGNVLNQFGLDASETTRVVDVLSKASIISALDFEKLRESMKVAGPAANSLGISLEETTAVLAALADLGISGSLGGTAFKKFVSSAAKSGKSVTEVFEQIANSADPAAESIKLLGDRTFGAGIAIAKSKGKLKELLEQLRDVEGTTKRIAAQKLDNLSGDVTLMKSAWAALSIEIGEIFTPILRFLVQTITKFIGWLQKVVINIKLLFKGISKAFITLTADLLGGIATFRQWLNLDTTKIDAQIKGMRDRVKELNFEIDILNGKKLELDAPKKKPGQNEIGKPQERNTSSANAITADGINTLSTTGPEAPTGGIFNKDAANIRDQEYKEYVSYMEQIQSVNSAISDSFSDLGNNIANSLTNSMGVFGAFLGTVIQGLLDLAAQAITSAITTAITEKAKQGAYGATAQAAAVAAAAESAASTGPGAIALLPIFIAGALAAVAAAMSGTGGKISRGGGTSARSTSTTTTRTPQSSQGDGSGQMGWRLDGQDLIFALDAARSDRAAYS